MVFGLKPVEVAALAGLCLIGLFLRVFGAQNALWIDEIWSLNMVRGIGGPQDVFLQLVHDNNHPFNSLYLFLARGSDDPVTLRAFSILLGVLSIPAALWAGRAIGRQASWFMAALIAVGLPFVHYGSEARGYAGLILVSLIAMGLVLRSLQRLMEPRHRFTLAATVGLGIGFHLTMILTIVALGIGVLLFHVRAQGPTWWSAIGRTYQLFKPAFFVTVAWFLLLALAVRTSPSGGIEVGGVHPFAFGHIGDGLGDMLRLSFGLPELVGGFAALLAVLGLLVLAGRGRPNEAIWCLTVSGLVVLPAVLFAARLPNLEFPRYFLFSGLLVMFYAAAWVEQLDLRSGVARAVAVAGAVGLMAGHGTLLVKLFEHGRGGPDAVLAEVQAASETPTQIGAIAVTRTTVTADYFAEAGGFSDGAISITARAACPAPEWQIVELPRGQGPETTLNLTGECGSTYDLVLFRDRAELSGIAWALYRRVEATEHVSDPLFSR